MFCCNKLIAAVEAVGHLGFTRAEHHYINSLFKESHTCDNTKLHFQHAREWGW